MGKRRVDHQSADRHRHGDLGEDQHLPSVHGVGKGAPPQGSCQQRHQLGQTDQTDHQRRVGQTVNLKRDRHQGELRAQPRDHLAGPQPSEMPVPAKRRDVDDEPGHLSAATGRIAR